MSHLKKIVIKSLLLLVCTAFFSQTSFAADVDNDTLQDGLGPERCDGLYSPPERSGTCDTQAACDAQGACIHTLDFDCDGLNDNLEHDVGGSNPVDINAPNMGTIFVDSDMDGFGDLCDQCTDTDTDTWGNAGFLISGCAGSSTVPDNCPDAPNPGQEDVNGFNDGAGAGDACECNDTDGDGYGVGAILGCPGNVAMGGPATATTVPDNCPDDSNPDQADSNGFEDGAGSGDVCETPPPTPTLDVVLVMDRSGSMNGTAAGPVMGTKLQALQSAATMFVDQIAMDGTHRLGLVVFNSSANALAAFPFDFVNSGNSGTANGAIAGITATGSTNIIAGLDTAEMQFAASPQDRQAIVLFTDGRHNNPSVLSDADLTTALQGAIGSLAMDGQFYSIGFGTSVSDAALSGVVMGTTSGTDFHVNEIDLLGKSFSEAAVSMMNNEMFVDPLFELMPGKSDKLMIPVSVADQHITFVINWDHYNPNLIRTAIVPPSGDCKIVDQNSGPGFKQAKGINYRVIRVTVPFECNGAREHAGNWEVRIARQAQGGHVPISHTSAATGGVVGQDPGPDQSERVNVFAYGASGIKLSNQLALKKSQLQITGSLTAIGIGLAEDASFTAYVLPPLPQTDDSTQQDKIGSESGSDLPAPKLTKRIPIKVSLKTKPESSTRINATGELQLKAAGVYQVRIVATGKDARGQAIQREQISSIYYEGSNLDWIKWLIILLILLLLFWVIKKLSR